MPTNRKNPIRGTASDPRYSLMEFMAEFPADDACLTYLWRSRYSADEEHAVCPRCQVERTFHRYHTAQQRQSWTCSACGLHVHPTAGTIFHKSSTSLHLWFYALYLITSTRCVIRNSLMAETGPPSPRTGQSLGRVYVEGGAHNGPRQRDQTRHPPVIPARLRLGRRLASTSRDLLGRLGGLEQFV